MIGATTEPPALAGAKVTTADPRISAVPAAAAAAAPRSACAAVPLTTAMPAPAAASSARRTVTSPRTSLALVPDLAAGASVAVPVACTSTTPLALVAVSARYQ